MVTQRQRCLLPVQTKAFRWRSFVYKFLAELFKRYNTIKGQQFFSRHQKWTACHMPFKRQQIAVCIARQKIPAVSTVSKSQRPATNIKHYTKRRSTEVCLKKCKQLMGVGNDHSQNFDAQVFAATISFLPYTVLSYLNEAENMRSKCILFEHLADEAAR